MTPVMTSLKKFEDDLLEGAGRVQEPIVKFTGEMATRLAPYVPERPDWEFLAEVPTMNEMVDFQLKFTKRVVDNQVVFVRKMMKAMQPAIGKLEPKAAAKARKAPAATARKASAATAA